MMKGRLTRTRTAGASGHQGRLSQYYDERYTGDYMTSHSSIDARRVADFLGRVRGEVKSVLDYGCGRGTWTPALESAFPAATLVGIDVSEVAVGHARATFPNQRFEVFDGRRAPVDDESFDLVFSFHVLEHVAQLDEVVRDMIRVTKMGGQLVVVLPCGNAGSLEARLVTALGGRQTGAQSPSGCFFFEDEGHLRRPTSVELEERFILSGATPVDSAFANQSWGAVHWITHSSSAVLGCVFESSRTSRKRQQLGLWLLRRAFGVLGLAVRAGRASKAQHSGQSAAASMMRPILKVGVPVLKAVDELAWREWMRDNRKPNGSAQYYIFERAVPAKVSERN
jgi:SAM-dependent methyltransferase